MGWQRSYADAVHVWEQTQHIRLQSKKDDSVDADGDGIADVRILPVASRAKQWNALDLMPVPSPVPLAWIRWIKSRRSSSFSGR